MLRGVFGRSLQTRVSAYFRDAEADPTTRVYLFAHETLRVTAEEQLGSELARYRQGSTTGSAPTPTGAGRILRRATPYAATRACSLRPATSRGCRHSPATPRRHAFLLRATGSDYAALTEIRDAQRLITAQNVPDLQALVELAVYRHAISIRNQSIPVGLPAVWARLGRFDHAEALARAIADRDAQDQALAELVTVAASDGGSGTAPRPSPRHHRLRTPRRERSPSWPPRPLRPADGSRVPAGR